MSLSTNKGVKYTSVLFIHGINKALLVSDSCRATERNGNSISTEVMNTPLKSIKILLVSALTDNLAVILDVLILEQ